MNDTPMTQPKDQSALEACPFCNCSAYIVEGRDPIMGLDWFWATCQHLIDPHKGSRKPTYAEAIAAWNQRAEPDELARLRAEVDALREDCKKLSESEIIAHCEGCGAWLLPNDDFVMGDDAAGCWSTMTDSFDAPKRPCFAYRVGKPDARKALENRND